MLLHLINFRFIIISIIIIIRILSALLMVPISKQVRKLKVRNDEVTVRKEGTTEEMSVQV